MCPGNTADVGSLIPAIDRLRKRFCGVGVVADRGMISAETIAELEVRDRLSFRILSHVRLIAANNLTFFSAYYSRSAPLSEKALIS